MSFDTGLIQGGMLLGTAILAGAVNGIAGGGGLLVFPMLLLTGLEPLTANATNAAAMWVGTVSSAVAYRQEFRAHSPTLWRLTLVSVLGGLIGAGLLLRVSSDDFAQLIPYLLLGATLLFALGQPFVKRLGYQDQRFSKISNGANVSGYLCIAQGAIATYGGFFGGGMGILMLAVLRLTGVGSIHTQNAFKVWLAICINAVAVTQFAIAGIIAWPQTLLMAMGAALGGYGSALLARHVPTLWIRTAIIAVGLGLSLYFFVHNPQ